MRGSQGNEHRHRAARQRHKGAQYFPEGNVYLTNDRVSPFLDGAAFIALKAQAAAGGAAVTIVPMSIKFTHLTAPRTAITERMLQIGADSGYAFPAGSSQRPLEAVLGLGRHILGMYLKKHDLDHDIPDDAEALYHRLQSFAENLVGEVERGLGIDVDGTAALPSRITKTRARIHQLHTAPDAAPHPEIDGLAERAILALRIHGYLTPYLTDCPTIDRYDETVERISEDFYSRNMPRTGPRRVIARLAAPIDVRSFASMKSREAIAAITREMETRIQHGIDTINTSNDAPGASLAR